MFKQSPTTRNHRSKGCKTKHVLQICLLLAVCFWLIYQVKRSYEKRKEFDEDNSTFSIKKGGSDEFIQWGRKSLLPRSETNGKQVEDDDNREEDEENKPEEEDEEEVDQDQDDKFEEENDEGRGSGDDVVDEHDQEKSDEDVEQEDEPVDETDMKNSKGDENSRDRELDDDSGSTHEAQEELYKADDASSAVTHDTQMVTAENDNSGLEVANQSATVKIISGQNITAGGHENMTGHEESTNEHSSSNSTNTSFMSLTSLEGSNNHLEVRNSSQVSGETRDVSMRNSTRPSFGSNFEGNVTGMGPTTFMQPGNQSWHVVEKTEDSNSTISAQTRSFSENTTREHVTFNGAGDKLNLSAVEAETSETGDEGGGIDERLDSSNTDNLGEIGQDLIDPSDTSSIPLEEREIGTDLETLPEIQNEGSNTEDAAAE